MAPPPRMPFGLWSTMLENLLLVLGSYFRYLYQKGIRCLSIYRFFHGLLRSMALARVQHPILQTPNA